MTGEHSWRRTIAKAFTYRLASFTLATIGLGFFLGIPLDLNLFYNAIMALASFVMFITNELLWRKTGWGKTK